MTDEQPRATGMLVALTAVGLVLAGAAAWVMTLPDDAPPISYRVITVAVGDPEQVTVTFEVTRPLGRAAECQVTATGENNDVVNRLNGIRIPASSEGTTTHTVVVPTDAPATAAAVASCVLTG